MELNKDNQAKTSTFVEVFYLNSGKSSLIFLD